MPSKWLPVPLQQFIQEILPIYWFNYFIYNWNIVESGVKYHNPNPSPLHVSAPKDQVIIFTLSIFV
jgi:hypothetical protein